ncbi:SDR family NAD(P)-dependent oxidoreductase [Streptomyces sp. NPDC050619]|uniref:SDR family NAD(P)-dependent oxidoreductase n=1 Tax=Streptomyces sp. NPDC050619 TaxID=3157214 RepID=UPI00343123CD
MHGRDAAAVRQRPSCRRHRCFRGLRQGHCEPAGRRGLSHLRHHPQRGRVRRPLLATEGGVTPIVMDITDDAQVEEMARIVDEQVGDQGLFALISNAGILVPGPMEIVSMEGIRRQFDVNVFGHVATIKALLPALRRGRGRIVEIGSLTGHVALPYKGILAGSKFAMEGLMDLLRRELLPWSIPVTIVRAGKMRTNALPKAARNQQALIDGLTPEQEALYGESLRRFAKADLDDPNPPTRVLTDPEDQKILDLVDSLSDQEADQKIAHMMGVI